MVQMDFLAANRVCIVGLCGHAHRTVIFAIAHLSCLHLSLKSGVAIVFIPWHTPRNIAILQFYPQYILLGALQYKIQPIFEWLEVIFTVHR